MHALPVMLKVRGQRCVIVGGGPVARRRAAALVQAGAKVTLVAPHVDELVADLPVTVECRTYRTGDLKGACLVVVATDDPAVNAQVAADAEAAGVLVNRCDEPEAGDFTVPAHAHHGPITLAVHTSGISASAAAMIRRQLSDALDPDWPRLLEIVAPYRGRLQARFPDREKRTDRLRRLTDDVAVNILKTQGPDALRRHCEALLEP